MIKPRQTNRTTVNEGLPLVPIIITESRQGTEMSIHGIQLNERIAFICIYVYIYIYIETEIYTNAGGHMAFTHGQTTTAPSSGRVQS